MSTNSSLQGELVVSSKILGHISEGLYRGPSGVFKELASNSFDADARNVWISTGRPTFDVVSVRDDGDGMTLQKFHEVVSGGIGDSDKRVSDARLINGRQVIGRLGIGILGVSQISHEFSVVSHVRATQEAFRAVVRMKDFRHDILDSYSADKPEWHPENGSTRQGYAVGEFEAEEIEFDTKRAGFTITATDPTEGFRRQLEDKNLQPLPREFRRFIESSRRKDKLATGPLYDHMIWQLASLLPIPYMADSTVSDGDRFMPKIAEALRAFDFSVIVDGVKLFRPVLLEGPVTEDHSETPAQGDGPFQFPLEFDDVVWGTKLSVKGYIYGSAGSALHPDDIRGILIRLKHVGIGEYDKSLFDYRYAEGPRYAWLTGELFVEQGLEDALTVGRDGFDGAHPHYLELRRWLHTELRSRVFPALYRGIRSRRVSREAVRNEQRDVKFLESISAFANTHISIQEVAESCSPPVEIDLEQGVAIVNTAVAWPRGSRQREMAKRLGIVFALVQAVDTSRSEIEEFISLTQELLSLQ